MAEWREQRTTNANRNTYDRFRHEPEGAAVVYMRDDRLFGWCNGRPFDVGRPPRGNVQAVRIRPEEGLWRLYCLNDPNDQERIEYVIDLMAI